jgi:hypothetical protein
LKRGAILASLGLQTALLRPLASLQADQRGRRRQPRAPLVFRRDHRPSLAPALEHRTGRRQPLASLQADRRGRRRQPQVQLACRDLRAEYMRRGQKGCCRTPESSITMAPCCAPPSEKLGAGAAAAPKRPPAGAAAGAGAPKRPAPAGAAAGAAPNRFGTAGAGAGAVAPNSPPPAAGAAGAPAQIAQSLVGLMSTDSQKAHGNAPKRPPPAAGAGAAPAEEATGGSRRCSGGRTEVCPAAMFSGVHAYVDEYTPNMVPYPGSYSHLGGPAGRYGALLLLLC